MPSFEPNLSEEERWALAYYILSIARKEQVGSNVVLISKFIDGELPKDPDDPQWEEAESLAIALAGQIITKPRWQNPSILTVYVRSLYNDREIAFRIEWDDRTKNVTHDSTAMDLKNLMADTYVPASHLFKTWNLRDAICLQFPVKIPDGPEKPHFFWGQAGKKVNLWKWHADLAELGNAKNAVIEMNGTGYTNPLKPQPEGSQSTFSQSRWSDGTWRVVMWRSLTTNDAANDIQFERGKMIPFAVQAWDGANGEFDKIMSLSAWAYVVLETPKSLAMYLYVLLGMILAGVFEIWLVNRTRNPSETVEKFKRSILKAYSLKSVRH